MPQTKSADPRIGNRIRTLRKRFGCSVRTLSEKSGVSVAMISYAERGVYSMSLVTLEKILTALGTSLSEFFSDQAPAQKGPVFTREKMRTVSDPDRTYTIVSVAHGDVPVQMLDEHIRPSKTKPTYSKLDNEVMGYVLSGSLILDIKGEKSRTVREGDAFHLPKGTTHRGYASDDGDVHLISVTYIQPA